MIARFARIGTALGAVGLTLAIVAGPAQAGGLDSVTANPGNAWVISELAAEAGTIPASSEVSAYAAQVALTSTTGTAGAAGVTATAGTTSAGAPWGMILNSVAVLGGVSLLWGGGSGAPAVPGVQTGDYTLSQCSGGAWAGGTGATITCGGFISLMSGSTGRYWFRSGREVASGSSTVSVTISDTANTGTSVKRTAGPYLYEAWTAESAMKTDAQGNYWTPAGTRVGTYWIGNIPAGSTQPMPSNPNPVTAPESVPHTITSTAECVDAGGVSHTITNTTPSFTFNPASSFTFPQTPDIACPSGQWLKSGERHLDTPGTSTTVPLVQPYTAPTWVGVQATQFPECFPVGSLKCQLEIYKLSTSTHPEYKCHDYAIGGGNPCLDWHSDPDRHTKYECRFGSTVVAMRRCSPYAQAFSTGVVTSTPADPDASEDPAPEETDPTPEQTPGDTGCVPHWGDLLSPWWVYKAGVCALTWAFVPDAGYLQDAFNETRTAWADTYPGAWVAGVAGITWPASPGSSCQGPHVQSDFGHGIAFDTYPLDACSGAAAGLATLSRIGLSVFFGYFGGMACVRAIGSGFNWNPGTGRGES